MARDRRPFRTVPRPPAPGEPWGPTTRRRPGAIRGAARLTGRAVTGYGRWVAHAPETRGLGTALAALYPAAEIAHLAHTDPLMMGAFAPPAALAAWTSTYKAHHSRRYSAAATAAAAGVPAWLATAAATGITDLHVLLGYSAAAAVGWSAVTWSDVLAHRRALRARWDTIATAAGLEDSRLVRQEETRTGQRFTVDIRHTRKTARQLAGRDLADRIAGVLALPAERVKITTDPRHAGNIIITVQTTDPWAAPVTHPALGPAHTPARQSVMAGPMVLGTDPDTGHGLDLTVYDKDGAWHTFIVAATNGGKTTLYSNMAEDGTGRTDMLVWGIDLRKGTIPFYWGQALDARAGIGPDGRPEYGKALAIVAWGAETIRLRSATSGGKNHVPTPGDPAILILLDEGDTLLGAGSPVAHKAREHVADIWRGGRSAGVGLAFAGQRGVMQYTGTKDVHANSGNKIVLRVNRAAEMNNILPDWEADGMPDMHSYAPGKPGVALLVGPDSRWRAGRVRDLSDLDAVAALARRRGRPTAALPPGIAARLPGYTTRDDPVPAASGAAILTLPTTRTGHQDQAAAASGAGPSAVARLTRLSAAVQDRLADMPEPPGQPTSLADLIAARDAVNAAEHNDPATNQAIPIPDGIAEPILTLLGERGDTGARRDEIVAMLGKSRSAVANWLAILRDHGLISASGAGKAARYHLPEHAPGAGEDIASADDNDDAA